MCSSNFNLESTLALIVAEVREAEIQLRRLLEPLGAALGTVSAGQIDWSKYFHFINELSVCIIKPMPDWHYLFKFMNQPPQLDEVQRKQWQSYMEEINHLLRILFLLCPDKVNAKGIKDDVRNGINQKLSTLQLSGKIDRSTFSGIITALNRFIPQLWVATYTSLMEADIIYKTPVKIDDLSNGAPNEPKK